LADFQKLTFQAGHVHAGVLIKLILIAQLILDYAALNNTWKWMERGSLPMADLLVSGGFFAAIATKESHKPICLFAYFVWE
jgi:hypothetical protein